ncbi:DUF1549 domain-containing protein [Planctomycetota bacterium]
MRISEEGNVAVLRPGRHTVLVRFGTAVEPLSITIPFGSTPTEVPALARRNWIDDSINETLVRLRIPFSPQADDASFLRRVHLDLTGRLPASESVLPFLSDASADKREQLIDRLLHSAEFTEYWTFRLAELLRIRAIGSEMAPAQAMHRWVSQSVRTGVGWDAMAVEMICAEGDSHTQGAATMHRLSKTPREQAEYLSEVMMGVRLRCANCHNHPLDKWTQDDYHGLAQIFASMDRRRHVRMMSHGAVTNPRTGLTAVAYLPGKVAIDEEHDARRQFARWLTDEANPYFAKAMVGRIWQSLMGRGLIDPVDDVRATNPPSHPELLDRLAETFATDHAFEIQKMIRLICNSAAYSRSSRSIVGNESDSRFYSHMIEKPLSAQVLADAITDATGVSEPYGDLPTGTRAVSLVSPTSLDSRALSVLGVCDRSGSCAGPSSGDRGIATKLHLLNGALLNAKITSPHGRLSMQMHAKVPAGKIIEQLYLRTVCRMPTQDEQQFWDDAIQDHETEGDVREQLQDLFWGLLNCREFTTNH